MYRGPSTAAAKAPPSLRMTILVEEWEEQATAKAKQQRGELSLHIPPFAKCCEGWGTRAFWVGQRGTKETAKAGPPPSHPSEQKPLAGDPGSAKEDNLLSVGWICGSGGWGYWRLRRRRSWAVASRWQGRQRVRRLSRSHWPPPSATGRMWSASQRERRAVMDFMP